MGYQVFPAASGAADYENVGVHVEGNTAPIADAVLFSPIRARFTISSALTAGIYLAETDELTTVTANVIINNSTFRALNSSMGTATTSGVTLITVSTNQSSFQTEAQMGWNQEGNGPFAGSTAQINFTYAPVQGDTKPFVVAGGAESASANQIQWSTNGISWTGSRPAPHQNTGQSGPGRIAWVDGSYNLYWVGFNGANTIFWSTDAGANWTTKSILPFGSAEFGYYDSTFARHYVWSEEGGSNYTPWTSTNAINWTSTNKATGNANPSFIRRIGDRLYIGAASTLGAHTAALAFTTNGTNWNNVTTWPTSTGGAWALTYSTAVGRYVATGSRGGMFHSTDGLNWTTGDRNTNLGANAFQPGWYSVDYGDGYYIAAGSHSALADGVILSTDGMNWTNIGATSGVLTQGSTSNFIWQGTYNPSKAANWLWYQFSTRVIDGELTSPSDRLSFRKNTNTPVWYHNNVVGRIKQGFNFILTRFKMGRDIR